MLKDLTSLANRWRRLELSNWKTILEKRIKVHSQGAWRSWFYIYRLVIVHQSTQATQAGTGVDFMSSLEQFIQTSTVGEFSERLRLLSVFQVHLSFCQENCMSSQLSNILRNVLNYYREFVEPVQQELKDGLEKIEKELKDFVKLAKWEDRGYYAMKYGADRAQRKLHKLCLNADKVLNIPAVIVLTKMQNKLSLRNLESAQDAKSDCADISEAIEIESKEKWRSYCAQYPGQHDGYCATEPISRMFDLHNSNLRYNQLPRLVARMHRIVGCIPKGDCQILTIIPIIGAQIEIIPMALHTLT